MSTMARLASSPSSLGSRSRPLSVPSARSTKARSNGCRPMAASAASPVPTAVASAPSPSRQTVSVERMFFSSSTIRMRSPPATAGGESARVMRAAESYLVPATAAAVGSAMGAARTAGRAPGSAASTLTRGSPRKPRSRPSTWLSISGADALRGRRCAPGRRAAPARAPPRARGAGRGRWPTRSRARRGSAAARRGSPCAGARRRPSTRSRSFFEVGPRFEPDEPSRRSRCRRPPTAAPWK